MSTKDRFLANFPRQPKKVIADYVAEETTLRVPRRFASLKEAVASGVIFLLRSESPHEYNGAAGLLESFLISPERIACVHEISEPEIFVPEDYHFRPRVKYNFVNQLLACAALAGWDERVFARQVVAYHPDVRNSSTKYCQLLGLVPEEFLGELSFSCWEYIEGLNGAIIADSALTGRYHLLAHDVHIVFEESGVRAEFSVNHPPALKIMKARAPELREMYETLRGLPHFNSCHCPLVEFQISTGGELYFLQYHRSRDFSPAEFILDREPQPGEIEARFVRGATPAAGITSTAVVYHSDDQLLDPAESIGFELNLKLHLSYIFSELMSRIRDINILRQDDDSGFIPAHLMQSQLFNPRVSVVVDLEQFFTPGEYSRLFHTFAHTFYVRLHLISDGRKAFLRKEGPLLSSPA